MDTLEITKPAGIGHNAPPSDLEILAQALVDETTELKHRAAELIEVAGEIKVVDDESAGKATALAAMIKTHAGLIETARQARKDPFLRSGQVVDNHFGTLRASLVGTDPKKLGGPCLAVVTQVDEYRRKKEAEAAAERKRLADEAAAAERRAAEEARKRREAEAEVERQRLRAIEDARLLREENERRQRDDAARIAAAEAAARVSGDLAAAAEASRLRETQRREAAERETREANERAENERKEKEAAEERAASERREREAAEEAERLQRACAQVTAAPITSGYGPKAFSRTIPKYEVTDKTAALKHALKVNPEAIHAAVEEVIKGQMKAKVTTFPGVRFWNDTSTTIRK
jgi:hypothetical protein